jgi:hypothetical protein
LVSHFFLLRFYKATRYTSGTVLCLDKEIPKLFHKDGSVVGKKACEIDLDQLGVGDGLSRFLK